MNATAAICRNCRKPLDDDSDRCGACGTHPTASRRAVGVASRPGKPAGAATASAAATAATAEAGAARRMVTDGEVAARGARWARSYMGTGVALYALAWGWLAFGPGGRQADAAPPAASRPTPRPLGDDESAALRARLRSDNPERRARAEARLRDAGAVVDFDRQVNLRPKRPGNGLELLDAWAEVRGDSIVVSVRSHFGPELFVAGSAVAADAAQVSLVVRGATLAAPVETVLAASPGENRGDAVGVVSGLVPGRYDVEIGLRVVRSDASGASQRVDGPTALLSVERSPGPGPRT